MALSASGGSIPSTPCRLIPNLPDEISLQCLARVPRHVHPILSLVCRSWRALCKSPTLFSARVDLNQAKNFVCVGVRTPLSQYLWYLFDRRGLRGPLTRLPSPPYPTVGSACVASGPFLYLLGGSDDDLPTSMVQIFDARFNRWTLGPRMGAARQFAAAGVVRDRLFVLGGCPTASDSWAQVLPLGQDEAVADGCSWADVDSPLDMREKWMHGNVVIDGKVLAVADSGGVVYDPENGSWGSVSSALDLGWRGRAATVGRRIYSYDYLGQIKAFDPGEDKWMEVKGIDKDLPKFLCGATLADAGDGRLCVVWESKRSKNYKEMELMFAEIQLGQDDGGGLSGFLVWSDSVVLPVPKSSVIAYCFPVHF